MNGRDNKVYEEAAALWRKLSSETQPAGADASTMLDLMLRALPPAGYERLANPHLRPTAVAFPKRPGG